MDLPVMPPVQPMLAKSVKGIPDPAKFDAGLSFEPKWDGFRCIVFKDGDEVELTSRNTKPLTRYFPEVVEAVREQLPDRCVLDGELFVAIGPRLEFEVLQERIHPAESRINMLAEKTPASLRGLRRARARRRVPGRSSRSRPVARASRQSSVGSPVRSTSPARPPTPARQRGWFEEFEGAGLDGVIAKPLGAPYQPNARTMLKIKHERTADVVVAGYRLHKTSTPEKPLLGSLLLGLYADGKLQHVGVSASFTAARRAELLEELRPLEVRHRRPPLGRVAGVGDRQPRPRAGHPEPLERRQGPVVHTAASRARARGQVRRDGGQQVPAHRALQAVAHRSRPGVVRLRATGAAGELRPH